MVCRVLNRSVSEAPVAQQDTTATGSMYDGKQSQGVFRLKVKRSNNQKRGEKQQLFYNTLSWLALYLCHRWERKCRQSKRNVGKLVSKLAQSWFRGLSHQSLCQQLCLLYLSYHVPGLAAADAVKWLKRRRRGGRER